MTVSKSELAAKNLKIIENYHEALNTVKKDLVKNQSTDSDKGSEQNTLESMILSNQNILNYLNHLKSHQHTLSNQALEEILSKLTREEHKDIHTTIMKFREDIAREGQVVSVIPQ